MEMQTRIRARQLRMRLEGHPAPCKIANAMDDADLVARHDAHEANRIVWRLEEIAKRNAGGRQ